MFSDSEFIVVAFFFKNHFSTTTHWSRGCHKTIELGALKPFDKTLQVL